MKKTLLILLLFCSQLKAEMWVDTRDVWLRADIEYLSDIGVIKAPILTWPLMWAPILKDLSDVELATRLSSKEMVVYRRVKRKGRLATRIETNTTISFKAGSDAKVLRGFGDDRREKGELTSKFSGVSKNFAWNIETTKAFDSIDGKNDRLDNSYIAGVLGNWVLSVGSQERWWGPSWDSSLILSNNARPVPSISVQRNYSEPFETKWLSWIGPWTLNAFAGQLESNRTVPHAKLLGMSINLKPLDYLEIGLRRTAQWGGRGRSESFDNLVNLITGQDNCSELTIENCGQLNSAEPGNQLAGLDFKIKFPKRLGNLYGQFIGEDEAGLLPSRTIMQLGYSNYFSGLSNNDYAYLEYADTLNSFRENLTYNHRIYENGYRYNNRSIGSSFDNDSRSITLGYISHLGLNDHVSVKLQNIDLNVDNSGIKHSISDKNVTLNRLSLKWRMARKIGVIEIDLSLQDKKLYTTDNVKIPKATIGLSFYKNF